MSQTVVIIPETPNKESQKINYSSQSTTSFILNTISKTENSFKILILACLIPLSIVVDIISTIMMITIVLSLGAVALAIVLASIPIGIVLSPFIYIFTIA